MEILVAVEFLADQRRAHDLAVTLNHAAICLSGKDDLGDAGYRQRIGQPADKSKGEENDDRRTDFAQHGCSPQTRCRPLTRTSMALMPMNGMITPPTP